MLSITFFHYLYGLPVLINDNITQTTLVCLESSRLKFFYCAVLAVRSLNVIDCFFISRSGRPASRRRESLFSN